MYFERLSNGPPFPKPSAITDPINHTLHFFQNQKNQSGNPEGVALQSTIQHSYEPNQFICKIIKHAFLLRQFPPKTPRSESSQHISSIFCLQIDAIRHANDHRYVQTKFECKRATSCRSRTTKKTTIPSTTSKCQSSSTPILWQCFQRCSTQSLGKHTQANSKLQSTEVY